MAQRRMFSKTITSSSEFLMMSSSIQNLYFQLGMNADDDGFCEHFMVQKLLGSPPDELRILEAKHFVEVFDQKVLMILDWKENNYIPKDRYTPSKHLETYKDKIAQISRKTGQKELGIQPVYKVSTQVRLGEVRLGNTATLKKSFWANPLFIKYQGKYPDRDYDLAFEEMCAWWVANKKKPPKSITAFGKWLSNTPVDQVRVDERRRLQSKLEQEQRQKQTDEVVDPAKIQAIREKIAKRF